MSPTPKRHAKAPHPRSLQDVVNVSLFTDTAFPFVVINLEHDLERAMYLTMKLATESEHPIVRKMYGTACRYFGLLDDLMTEGSDVSLQLARDIVQFPEPWELRLGYAGDGSIGNGLGAGHLGDMMFDTLRRSPWLRRLLRTEPDALSSIEQVGMDRVGDILGTICKSLLIEYTVEMAARYRFDSRCMRTVVVEGCWLEEERRLGEISAVLPVDDLDRVFLLVPGEICRSAPAFSAAQFLREMGMTKADASGMTAKERMMADAESDPARFSQFVKDRMRDSRRFRCRKEYRRNRKK